MITCIYRAGTLHFQFCVHDLISDTILSNCCVNITIYTFPNLKYPLLHTHTTHSTGMAEEGPSSLLKPGSRLQDRWEVLKKIGGGGFGEVYKARDTRTGQVSPHTGCEAHCLHVI